MAKYYDLELPDYEGASRVVQAAIRALKFLDRCSPTDLKDLEFVNRVTQIIDLRTAVNQYKEHYIGR